MHIAYRFESCFDFAGEWTVGISLDVRISVASNANEYDYINGLTIA